jgi:hypothetical protein
MTRVVAGALALVLLGGPGQARADMIVNGGFETGDFSGWTLSGNTGVGSGYTFVSSTNPHSGGFDAALGPVGGLGFLSQTVPTTPGATYTLSFALASYQGLTPNEFQASFGGTPLADLTNLTNPNYTTYTFIVTAASSSSVLQFGFQDDPSFLQLDDVSLTPQVGIVPRAPEPGSWALFALGALGLARAVRPTRR